MNKYILIIGIFLGICTSTHGQGNRAWKRQRYNAYAGLGMINFLGDLGGGKGDAHWLKDFNFAATRPLITIGFRYKTAEAVAVGAALSFGYYSGDDKNSKNPARKVRNLHFRSPLIELSVFGEYHIITEKFGRRASSRRRTKVFSWQAIQSIPLNTYVFGGVGVFWFNPQAKYDGKWYNLQPMGTEGQNILPSRSPYSRLQISIPFGLGIRYSLDRRFSIGLEYGPRYTFTDYMDDVSTNYIDPAFISDNPIVQYFADPSGKGYGPNNKRGDALKHDYYMFTQITLSYKMRTSRSGLPKF